MAMYIRIHPFNPKRGFKVKRYVYRGQRFEVERGWYEVSDDLAEEVRDLRQDAYDLDSKPVFQVADEEEAKKLSLKDHEAENPEVKISQAVDGAQSVEDDKLDEEPPAAKAKKKKAAKKKAAKSDKGKGGTVTTDDLPKSDDDAHVFGK